MILLAAVGIWRLMQGPIALDRLVPYVEAGFARTGLGLDVSMSGVRVGIDRGTHQLDLRLRDVALALPNGDSLATLPEVAASFGLGSLIRGRLAPTRLVVERPVLQLRRDTTGMVSFRIGNTAASGMAPAAVAALLGPPQDGTPLGQLRTLRVRDATLIVDDQLLGRRWQADHLDAAVSRDAGGSAGDLSLSVTLGSETTTLQANFRYVAARGKLNLGLAAGRIEPTVLASLVPLLGPLADVHMPVSGTLETQFDFAESKFEGFRADLGFGAGWLDSAQFAGGRLDLRGGELHAVYAPEDHQLRLERLAFDLGGGARIVIDGRIDGVTRALVAAGGAANRPLPGRVEVTLSKVPVARLGRLWPLALSPGGRRWALANIHDGMLDRATAQLDLTVDPARRSLDVVAAHGSMRYHDLTVTYLPGLPPVLHVGGTATGSNSELDFRPDAGTVKSLKLTGGSLKVSNFGAPVETATIDLAVAGPLRDALEIIDAKKLRYAHAAGIDPAAVGGTAEAQLHFKFPLLAALKLDDLDYAAKARLTAASVAKIALGHDLSDGDFTVEIARDGLRATGGGRFDGLPVTVAAAMSFHPKDGPLAVYRIGLRLDQATRQRLDYDLAPDRLSGPVALSLTYTQRDPVRASAALVLDLRAARLAVPEANWSKPAGQPGSATIDFDVSHQHIAGPLRLAMRARGLDGRYVIALSPDRAQVERVDITRLVIGSDDLAGAVMRRGDGWLADISGRRLDLHPLLRHAVSAESGSASPPLKISARFDQVAFGRGRIMQGVAAALSRSGAGWQSMQIDGRFANGHALSFSLGGALGPRRVGLTSDDLGATLRLFDVADNVVGGRLSVTGELTRAGSKPALRADINGADFSVVRAPVLTRILSLASYTGLASMMSGSGIPFSSLRGRFTYTEDGIALERLMASGESLGITASGTIDLDQDMLDLNGAIAPAHLLNSALGKVPVLGSLLMGGEGQSLFAANYELSGPSANPEVSVNPLSAIAPGFLRRLFQPFSAGSDNPPQPPP